jgi:hypothetical protein
MLHGDFWYNDVGTNLLAGVDDDPLNPPWLADTDIVDFLVRIPLSRDSFLRIVPNMLPDEQTRLMRLYNCAYPPPSNLMDPNSQSDIFQHRLKSAPVRTTGPKGGGTWVPGRH